MSKQSGQEHPEIPTVKKTKRNRHPTACSVKRRSYHGCGICGSENTADQGVVWCQECGAETPYLRDSHEGLYAEYAHSGCSCIKTHTYGKRGRTFQSRPLRYTGVDKCLDCGAVKSRFCPNGHVAWKHWRGEVYCAQCGYRSPGTIWRDK